MSTVGIADAKPPYVMFETKVEEDRTATLERGVFVGLDVDFAIITPAGSKDRIVRKVSEWFDYLKDQVSQERFPQAWYKHYAAQYDAWKQGQELPVEGTPLKTWPAASPAVIGTLLSLHIRTVEELAAANEETISRIGMGGRALKQQAVAWLEKADHGTARVNALEQQNKTLSEQNTELLKAMQALAEEVKRLGGKSLEIPDKPGAVGDGK